MCTGLTPGIFNYRRVTWRSTFSRHSQGCRVQHSTKGHWLEELGCPSHLVLGQRQPGGHPSRQLSRVWTQQHGHVGVQFGRSRPAVLCGGIAFESETFETAQQFLAERPEWAPPKLEFEVDHVLEEDAREWGLAIALALPIAFAFLAVIGGALLWFGPVGWVVISLEAIGTLVAVVLTVWSHSRWRMKRSFAEEAPVHGQSARHVSAQGVTPTRRMRVVETRLATLWLCRQTVRGRWDGSARPWGSP